MTSHRDNASNPAARTILAPWLLGLVLPLAAVWSLNAVNYPISFGDQWHYLLLARCG